MVIEPDYAAERDQANRDLEVWDELNRYKAEAERLRGEAETDLTEFAEWCVTNAGINDCLRFACTHAVYKSKAECAAALVAAWRKEVAR